LADVTAKISNAIEPGTKSGDMDRVNAVLEVSDHTGAGRSGKS
jgi:hypothetical protein